MLRLLIKETDRIKISDLEIKHEMTGYTYEVYCKIKKEFPDYMFAIALGSDNVNNVHGWKYFDKLIEAVNFVIVPRKGYELKTEGMWYNDPRHIVLSDWIPEVSSTELKKYIYKDDSKALACTTQTVLDYLYAHDLLNPE